MAIIGFILLIGLGLYCLLGGLVAMYAGLMFAARGTWLCFIPVGIGATILYFACKHEPFAITLTA